jgi:HEAT repeat protein
VAALKDNEWVCFSALESLTLLRDDSSIEPVMALIDAPSETLHYAAIETLGKIRSTRLSPALIKRIPKANDIEKAAIIKSRSDRHHPLHSGSGGLSPEHV